MTSPTPGVTPGLLTPQPNPSDAVADEPVRLTCQGVVGALCQDGARTQNSVLRVDQARPGGGAQAQVDVGGTEGPQPRHLGCLVGRDPQPGFRGDRRDDSVPLWTSDSVTLRANRKARSRTSEEDSGPAGGCEGGLGSGDQFQRHIGVTTGQGAHIV